MGKKKAGPGEKIGSITGTKVEESRVGSDDTPALDAPRRNKLWLLAVSAALAVWTLPDPLQSPSSGLDPSFRIGISMAARAKMQFGEEVAFTYGPLGWLLNETYLDRAQWLLSLAGSLAVHALLVAGVAMLVYRSRSGLIGIAAMALLVPVLVTMAGDYKLLMSAIIWLYLVLSRPPRRRDIWVVSGVAAMLATAALIKFNLLFAGVGILGAFALIASADRRAKLIAAALGTYLVTFLALWTAAGQQLRFIPKYLITGYEISSGFSGAMGANWREWHLILSLIALSFIVGALVYAVLKRSSRMARFIFLASGLLFLSFKHGFVRHDAHVLIFFTTIAAVLFGMYSIRERGKLNALIRYASLLFMIVFVMATARVYYNLDSNLWTNNIISHSRDYRSAAAVIVRPSFGEQVVTDAKGSVRDHFNLDARLVEGLKGRTIDVYPWDIALPWAYDLPWRPRPVFQSYSAYTSALDQINADHLKGERAPEIIAYAWESLDNKHPLFYEPATLAVMLDKYRYRARDRGYIFLSRKAGGQAKKRVVLDRVRTRLAQPVAVPSFDQGTLFAEVEIEYTLLGRLLKLVYRPSDLYVRFELGDGEMSRYYRYVPAVGPGGILVSDYVENADELEALFQGRHERPIKAMSIKATNPRHYAADYNVTFVGVKEVD